MSNTDTATQFLRALFEPYDSGFIELRFFTQDKRKAREFHPIGHEYQAAERAIAWDEKGWDCYFGVLPRDTTKDGTKRNVSRARWAWADVDVKRFDTMDDARQCALNAKPDILVCSGGGYHPYWMLTRECDVSTPERIATFEAQLNAVQRQVQSDPVDDTPRILRIPGTHNHKPHLDLPLVTVEYNLPEPEAEEVPDRPETSEEELQRWQRILDHCEPETVTCQYVVKRVWLANARLRGDYLYAERYAREVKAFLLAHNGEIEEEILEGVAYAS